MQNLRIGTWNINNGYLKFSDNEMKVTAIFDLMEKEKIDILALQEVNEVLGSEIRNRILEVDNYFLSKKFERIDPRIIGAFKSNNVIIARNKHISYTIDSYYLSYSLSQFNNKKTTLDQVNLLRDDIIFFNTNLDKKKSDLKPISDFLNTINYIKRLNTKTNIVFMGSFQSKLDQDNIDEFLRRLSKLDFKVIGVEDDIQKEMMLETQSDIIITPNNFGIEQIKVINDYSDISRNRPVVASVKYKKYFKKY